MPAKMPSSNYPSDTETVDARETGTESGYASGSSSDDSLPEIVFTKPHLQFLNRQLQFLEPQGQNRLSFFFFFFFVPLVYAGAGYTGVWTGG